MLNTIEREAEKFESEFFGNYFKEVPVFDFEIN